jgi:LuxR family maltose regulon positive regulatory protein
LALEHLLDTTARDRCVQLAAALLLPTYQAGQMSTVRRWLTTLGDSAAEQYPPLAVLAGWFAALTGQTADAQRWAAFVETASFDPVPMDGTASFNSARAMLRALMFAAGPQQMATDASLAATEEPPWSPWHAVALCLSAEAQMLLGDAERATALFEETSTVAAALGNVSALVVSRSELARLAMEQGRWAAAAEHLELALATVDEYRLHDYSFSVLAFAAAARLAAHRGDRQEMDRQLARAMRARPLCTFALPWVAVRVRLQLARVYAAIGDQSTTGHLLREIDDILFHRPALGTLVDEVGELRGTLTKSMRGSPSGPTPLSPAELRLLPYLQTHLTFREIAQRLFVSRNTVSSEVGSIYRKLGVSSRSGAVQQGTALGLLGE